MYKNLYLESSKQISDYKQAISNYEKIDSVRVNNIDNLTKQLTKSSNSNKVLSRLNKYLTGTSIGLAILTIIAFIK